MTDRLEAVARAVAYHMASVVARNNQPHMSGDPRERVPASLRREFDDGCLEAARAAIAALDAGGWRPIETAPKDGTTIDLWCAYRFETDNLGCRVADAFWDEDDQLWRFDQWHEKYRPTHWMPLPSAPGSVPFAVEGVCADVGTCCMPAAIKDVEKLRKALRRVRAAITNAEPDILTCTLWMHDTPAETVVDFISAALGEDRT